MNQPVSLCLALCYALLALMAAGCGRGDAKKADADRVLRAIDVLVAADRESKAEPLALLAATECGNDEACAVKSTCVSAFEPFVRAMNIKTQVRDALRTGEEIDREALLRKVEQAEQGVGESSRHMLECTNAAATLRAAYRL